MSLTTTIEDQYKTISLEMFKTAVEEGDVITITKLFSGVDKHMLSNIEEKSFDGKSLGIFASVSGMPKRSRTLLLLCAFYTSHDVYIDFQNALKNAVLAKLKKNVSILLQFCACPNKIRFVDKNEEHAFFANFEKLGYNIFDVCNDNDCYACDDTKEYENFKLDMQLHGY